MGKLGRVAVLVAAIVACGACAKRRVPSPQPRAHPLPEPENDEQPTAAAPQSTASAESFDPTIGRINIEYDRFSKSKSALLQNMLVLKLADRQLQVYAGAVSEIDGVQLGLDDGKMFIGVISLAREFHYGTCLQVEFMADGVLVQGERREASSLTDGIAQESGSISMTPREFVTLTEATLIEGRLCKTEFSLTPQQIARLRQFADEAGYRR